MLPECGMPFAVLTLRPLYRTQFVSVAFSHRSKSSRATFRCRFTTMPARCCRTPSRMMRVLRWFTDKPSVGIRIAAAPTAKFSALPAEIFSARKRQIVGIPGIDPRLPTAPVPRACRPCARSSHSRAREMSARPVAGAAADGSTRNLRRAEPRSCRCRPTGPPRAPDSPPCGKTPGCARLKRTGRSPAGPCAAPRGVPVCGAAKLRMDRPRHEAMRGLMRRDFIQNFRQNPPLQPLQPRLRRFDNTHRPARLGQHLIGVMRQRRADAFPGAQPLQIGKPVEIARQQPQPVRQISESIAIGGRPAQRAAMTSRLLQPLRHRKFRQIAEAAEDPRGGVERHRASGAARATGTAPPKAGPTDTHVPACARRAPQLHPPTAHPPETRMPERPAPCSLRSEAESADQHPLRRVCPGPEATGSSTSLTLRELFCMNRSEAHATQSQVFTMPRGNPGETRLLWLGLRNPPRPQDISRCVPRGGGIIKETIWNIKRWATPDSSSHSSVSAP
jgi:hypothetical protein